MSDAAERLRLIAGVVAETFKVPASSVTMDTKADDVQGWDSLAHTRVIMAIERSVGVRLPTRRAFAAADVGALCALVAEAGGPA